MTDLTPTVRSSKRKRAQVTYYESDPDQDGDDQYASDFEDDPPIGPSKKKRKIIQTKTTASRPAAKKKIFPFMLLPAELRNRIYEFALTAPEDIVLKTKRKNYRRIPSRQKPSSRSFVPHRYPLQPKALLLNKTIYAEAQPILYGKNRFSFENSTFMHCFLASIGTTNIASLTQVKLEGYSGRAGGYERYSSAGMDYPAMVLLAPAQQLREFEIGFSLYIRAEMGKEQRDNAVGFYRMAYPWLDARGEDAVEALRLVHMNMFSGPVGTGQVRPGPMAADRVRIFKEELRRVMKTH